VTAVALNAASPIAGPQPVQTKDALAEPALQRKSVAPVRRPQPPSVVPQRVVGPGTVELAIGAEQGVRVGDRYAILRTASIDGVDASGFAGEELVTVAEVVTVNPNRLVGNGSPGPLRLSMAAGGAGITGSREVTETYSTPQ